MPRKKIHELILIVVIGVLLAGCQPTTAEAPVEAPAADDQPAEEGEATAPTENLAGCVDSYAAGIDYFPDKAEIAYAEDFTIEYSDNYKVITVTEPWPQAEESVTYVLVQCGTPAPEIEADLVIEVPVDETIAMSTTYIPFLSELGLVDSIIGMDSTGHVFDPAVRERVDSGSITEIGYGSAVNVEATIDLDPDLILTYSSGVADYDAHPALQAAGMPVVIMAEQHEVVPLGRAEWIKFVAAFYNKEAEANAIFDEIATTYNEMAAMTADVTDKPTVFANTPYDGTWFMPGGQSFIAGLINDAGGDYLWAEEPASGTLFLDFETVFDVAQDGAVWINPSANSLEELEQADIRFAEFAAFQSGQVYAYTARMSDTGGNDFFESGVLHPERVLMDLIKAFHPDLLPDHDFFYYMQLQ